MREEQEQTNFNVAVNHSSLNNNLLIDCSNVTLRSSFSSSKSRDGRHLDCQLKLDEKNRTEKDFEKCGDKVRLTEEQLRSSSHRLHSSAEVTDRKISRLRSRRKNEEESDLKKNCTFRPRINSKVVFRRPDRLSTCGDTHEKEFIDRLNRARNEKVRCEKLFTKFEDRWTMHTTIPSTPRVLSHSRKLRQSNTYKVQRYPGQERQFPNVKPTIPSNQNGSGKHYLRKTTLIRNKVKKPELGFPEKQKIFESLNELTSLYDKARQERRTLCEIISKPDNSGEDEFKSVNTNSKREMMVDINKRINELKQCAFKKETTNDLVFEPIELPNSRTSYLIEETKLALTRVTELEKVLDRDDVFEMSNFLLKQSRANC